MNQNLKNFGLITFTFQGAKLLRGAGCALAIAVCLALTACKDKAPEATLPPPSPQTEAVKPEPAKAAYEPSKKTSFTEVTSRLDPGGSLFVYLATDQWLAGLSTNVTRFKDLIKSLPDVPEEGGQQIDQGFDALSKAIRGSGVERLTGVGISSVEIAPELHRSKFILHHQQSEGDGLLWNVLGRKAHPLSAMGMLPLNTALAGFGDIDLEGIWNTIERTLTEANITQATQGMQALQSGFEQGTGLSWTNVLASFAGEAGFILTMDEAKKITLPAGSEPIEIPEPGLLLLLKINNDTIYDHLSQKLKENPETVATEEAGLKMCAMPVPLPLPIQVQVTLATTGDYLIAATSPELVRTVLNVRRKETPGLAQSPEFKSLLQHLPAEGNQFFYTGKKFSETVLNVQRQAMSASENSAAQAAFLQQWLQNRPPSFGLMIGGHAPTGWEFVTVGNKDFSAGMLLAPAAAGVAVPAAMLLPALSNAKSRAQSVSCLSNMKQIGLAFRIWATDNDDQFPFHVKADNGGTLELAELAPDGFDVNAYRHFQVLSNELVTPKILVCPGDTSRQPADSFADLEPENVTYQLRTGKEVAETSPQEVLARCPIHGHQVFADGSVIKGDQ